MDISEKNKPKKMSVELNDLDVDLDGPSWIILDVTITSQAEDGRPGQSFDGKLLVSRTPIIKK